MVEIDSATLHVNGVQLDTSNAPGGPITGTVIALGAAELVRKGEDRHGFTETVVAGEELYIGLVADGHGGTSAAVYCQKMLLDSFIGAMSASGLEPSGKVLRDIGRKSFVKAHEEVIAMTDVTAGCTLTVVVINKRRHELTVLHSGDSVARLVPHKSKSVSLCEDHRIESSEAERARLERLGGQIARAQNKHGQPAGPLRLWPGGVAQARAIGDRDVGKLIEPRPFAQSLIMPEETCAVVICSDGVWDTMPSDAVDSTVRMCLPNTADSMARAIVSSALMQKHAYSSDGDTIPLDDTTCVIIRIEHEDDPVRADGCVCK